MPHAHPRGGGGWRGQEALRMAPMWGDVTLTQRLNHVADEKPRHHIHSARGHPHSLLTPPPTTAFCLTMPPRRFSKNVLK